MSRSSFLCPGSAHLWAALLLIWAVGIGGPGVALGQGFGFYEQSTCVMGRGGATVAGSCGDGSALFFNPAGIVGPGGWTVSAGLTALVPDKSSTGGRTRTVSDLVGTLVPLPHLYLRRGVTERLAVGVGTYIPYGLATEWPIDFSGRLDGLDEIGVEKGVLFAVGDATLAPHFSLGAVYAEAEQQGTLPPAFDVADNCAAAQAGGTTLVPFRYGFDTLLRDALDGTAVTLDCAADKQVLTGAEVEAVKATVQAYNRFIRERAEARGWAFVDVNPIFRAFRASGDVPRFPNTADPAQAFGPYFSLDGVHPSGAAHDLVANLMIEAINETYGTALDPLPGVPSPF